MTTYEEDRWLALCERFAARGVALRSGNVREDMIEHLLNCVEAIEQKLGGRPKNLDVRTDDGPL